MGNSTNARNKDDKMPVSSQIYRTNEERIKPFSIILPAVLIVIIILIMSTYMFHQRKNVIVNAENVTNQMAEYIASNIANEIDYGESSIKLSSLMISQTMTSATLEDPATSLSPMVENTPFEGIEFIQPDGMNVMNPGQPFDASDREYYIEGIKGKTGIWNNYHPNTSQETLINFYTPIVYKYDIVGVITGYIAATTQITPLFETELYGYPICGLLVDENNMVICSTVESEYEKDLTLEKFLDRFNTSEDEKQRTCNLISKATSNAVSYRDPNGEGRICIATIPGTDWTVVIIVPATSFNKIISDNSRSAIATIFVITLILVSYASFVLLKSIKRRREIALENKKLEEANQVAFAQISEIRDIIASANMGTWRIELVENQEPRMYVDATMKGLLGIAGQAASPEKTYCDWYNNIKPEAVPSVLKSVERMEQGFFDENTYLWIHPTKGVRYVRCGGTSQKIPGGFLLRGYHYDVDDVVRKEQAQLVMLQDALEEKNEYYSTLGTLGDVFYSMHVINLQEDTAVEFNAKKTVSDIVNHKNGAIKMMIDVMSASTSDEYKESALEFTDLTTLADRLQDKKIISRQFIGKNIGWFLASFIVMERDDTGRPIKVIYTTRNINEEKTQEEQLIYRSQTDELTGLLNRRAYEDDIYAHNDIPSEENFIYVSLDVNGLKIINDSIGHTAGDELIIGACQCMKKALSDYGKLYRIGGDEFVAILFCDDVTIKQVLNNFDTIIEKWTGKLVDSLSISYGWVSRYEEPDASVRQLGAIAEKRMYEAKSAHYRKKGFDRRGQQDAHKALCELYTKILKINITEDSYQIINMDVNEQSTEMGFSDKISEWLSSFGTSGQVHPDDLPEYLRLTNLDYIKDYFSENKTSLHIFYRRKCGDEYKQVMMELIPANDNAKDNMTLFLYVKDIDRD